jgi:hypothetical protein
MKLLSLFAVTATLLVTASCQPQEREDARVAAHAIAQAQRENDRMWKEVDAARTDGTSYLTSKRRGSPSR